MLLHVYIVIWSTYRHDYIYKYIQNTHAHTHRHECTYHSCTHLYLPQSHYLLYKAISVCGVIDLEFWVFPWIYDSPFFAAKIVPADDGCTLLPGPDEQLLLAQSYRRRGGRMRSDEYILVMRLFRCSVWWTYFLLFSFDEKAFFLSNYVTILRYFLCMINIIMLYHYSQQNLESATFHKAWTQTED